MRLEGKVEKSWGHENIIISNDLYCTKYLHFDKKYGSTSMHFHRDKHETWHVIKGRFTVKYVETFSGKLHSHQLNVGDVWINEPLSPHQLVSEEDDSVILETSTADSVEDNYRVYR